MSGNGKYSLDPSRPSPLFVVHTQKIIASFLDVLNGGDGPLDVGVGLGLLQAQTVLAVWSQTSDPWGK